MVTYIVFVIYRMKNKFAARLMEISKFRKQSIMMHQVQEITYIDGALPLALNQPQGLNDWNSCDNHASFWWTEHVFNIHSKRHFTDIGHSRLCNSVALSFEWAGLKKTAWDAKIVSEFLKHCRSTRYILTKNIHANICFFETLTKAMPKS